MCTTQDPAVSAGTIHPAIIGRLGAAPYIGLSRATLDELTRQGIIPSFKVGRRRLYRVVDLDEWIAAQIAGGDTA